MKCPYLKGTETIEETVNEFDDNQCCIAGTTVRNKKVILPNCLKEQCAAWQNNHCTYRK